MQINKITTPIFSSKIKMGKSAVPFGSFEVRISEYENDFGDKKQLFDTMVPFMDQKGFKVIAKEVPNPRHPNAATAVYTFSGKSGAAELELATKLAEEGWDIWNNGKPVDLSNHTVISNAKSQLEKLGI